MLCFNISRFTSNLGLCDFIGVKIGCQNICTIGSISAALWGPAFRPEKRPFCGGGGDGGRGRARAHFHEKRPVIEPKWGIVFYSIMRCNFKLWEIFSKAPTQAGSRQIVWPLSKSPQPLYLIDYERSRIPFQAFRFMSQRTSENLPSLCIACAG